MVAMSGVESLISWSSYYRATIHGARAAYANEPTTLYTGIALVSCPCAPTNPGCAKLCKCATKALQDINQARSDLNTEDQNLKSTFDNLDRMAGKEAMGLQISSISDEQKKLFQDLVDNVVDVKLAQSIADEANKEGHFPNELKASASSKSVNSRELEGGENCTGNGAACTRRRADKKLHFVYAAMGSRGFSFVTTRGQGALLQAKLQTIMPQRDVAMRVTNVGSGYFPAEGQQTHSAQEIDATEVWADDHGDIDILFTRGEAPCPPIAPGTSSMNAHVRSTHMADQSDEHVWTGGSDDGTQKDSHTMGTCTLCPGMWPSHMDYNFKQLDDASNSTDAKNPNNNWGQPKLYAVIQRDYGQRMSANADPWNLFFRFRMGKARETTFDNRGIQLTTDGTDISKATAVSAGIAYYKRAGDFWQEPPNFLNPFWRATLVSARVDKRGEQDLEEVLGAAAGFTKDAYVELKGKGYRAW
jgi:hypothetical protein